MFEPASSQKRARNLPPSCSSRTCLTTFEPCLQKVAMSEVGSFTADTASVWVVKTLRPSRKGGVVSRTVMVTRFSSSSFEKSRLASFLSPKPAWFSLLFSHISFISFFNFARMLTRSTIAACRFIFSSFSANFLGSISSTIVAAPMPPSSASYQSRSSLPSSYSSISASALIFLKISSCVLTSSVIDAYWSLLSRAFTLGFASSPGSNLTLASSSSFTTDLFPLKKTGCPARTPLLDLSFSSLGSFSLCRLCFSRSSFPAAQRSAEVARPPSFPPAAFSLFFFSSSRALL
mmetsp:Transcript_28052/g.50098  ORF Transcript_28052/g.50098 Transcript_28052/m.50098 type:complete len:290 (+) Transcript_28052:2550-3419(+)